MGSDIHIVLNFVYLFRPLLIKYLFAWTNRGNFYICEKICKERISKDDVQYAKNTERASACFLEKNFIKNYPETYFIYKPY